MNQYDGNCFIAQNDCLENPDMSFHIASLANETKDQASFISVPGPSNTSTVEKINPDWQMIKKNELSCDNGIMQNAKPVKNINSKLKLLPYEKRADKALDEQNPEHQQIKALDYKDIEKAAAVISAAFMDYPLPGQYILDIERRKKALNEIFKVELRKALKNGSVYTLNGDFQEVAIWKHRVVPESDLTYIKYMRLDTLKLLYTIRLKEYIKLFRALRNILEAKNKLPLPENTAELYIVGVNPANQGQGRLSRLLKPVLKAMQENEQPVLVMTNTKSNKKIYEHLGFKLIRVLVDQANDITAYYLVKDPYEL